ncbi:iron ABC transporter permease [Solidesulfovibrio sp.]|uniref:FecCD family ABC transporter permease n=1 Tax=Solidesulfovibrio sp. TaxID=2910990 RepID=UPI0026259D32|nr:iron ABC transporter permease [Solidesulfovibrio sp.]
MIADRGKPARAAFLSQGAPWLLALLLAVAAVWSLTVGNYPISLADQWRYVLDLCDPAAGPATRQARLVGVVLGDVRAPRLLAAVLIGAALSTSGAAYQSMFVNPLVSPGLLGVLAGASCGAALAMLAELPWTAVQGCAFAGGVAAVALALGLARLSRGDRLLLLVLGGVISTALFTALLSAVKYLADPTNQLPAITYWLMGGLSRADKETVLKATPLFVLGMAGLFLFSRQLDLLSLGDEQARSLGLSVGRARFWLIALSTVLSAATVSIAGLVGWVGLIIPHAGRLLVGPSNRRLLPTAGLLGGLYLLLVDDVSRLAFGVEIPLGILTALVGIPFFPLVLRNARRSWG